MTVTVQAGMTLAALQAKLAKHGQWLAIDPPHAAKLTIGELIADNPSGPSRYGYGTMRDHLIGIEVALADGTLIHSGGKVVKNVAGYDLLKLFVGSRGSLGVTTQATFRLRPLPESERSVESRCDTLAQADAIIEAVLKTAVTPIVLDVHNLYGIKVVLGFAGSPEEVEWQLACVAELGITEDSSLDYDAQFWGRPGVVQKISVLPSKICAALGELGDTPFVARAGNGVIYHRGAARARSEELPVALMRRVKDAYDPKHILPDVPL
jgi:glycolate oxidase FAD binding subunit